MPPDFLTPKREKKNIQFFGKIDLEKKYKKYS